jgi:hypothetical protein
MNNLIKYARIGALPSIILCVIAWSDLIIPGSKIETGPVVYKVKGRIANHSKIYQICDVADSFFDEVSLGDTISVEISNTLKWCRKITLIRDGKQAISTFDKETIIDSL